MKVRQVLSQILEMFKSGQIPAAVSFTMFPPMNIPANKWSRLNRLIMYFHGTQDARGFRQWRAVNRYVKKGVKAIYILGPRLKKMQKDNLTEDYCLIGFLSLPVFRVEDTDGQPLEYQEIKLPELPLLDKAHALGVAVKAIPAQTSYYGYYDKNEIALATPEEKVFFHELAHAAHDRIRQGTLKPGQDPIQEIVAELSAQALCHLVGKNPGRSMGNSYEYIERYALRAQPPMTPITACLKVLSEVEQVLNLIMWEPPIQEALELGKEAAN